MTAQDILTVLGAFAIALGVGAIVAAPAAAGTMILYRFGEKLAEKW